MKGHLRFALAAALSMCAAGQSAEAQDKFRKLTGAQIKAKFVNMELTDESHWDDVFERNGTLRSLPVASVVLLKGEEFKIAQQPLD